MQHSGTIITFSKKNSDLFFQALLFYIDFLITIYIFWCDYLLSFFLIFLCRIFGKRVAELPFIGTRVQFRRRGMCRLLVNMLEKVISQQIIILLLLTGLWKLMKDAYTCFVVVFPFITLAPICPIS